jgi:hypothetical protein
MLKQMGAINPCTSRRKEVEFTIILHAEAGFHCLTACASFVKLINTCCVPIIRADDFHAMARSLAQLLIAGFTLTFIFVFIFGPRHSSSS